MNEVCEQAMVQSLNQKEPWEKESKRKKCNIVRCNHVARDEEIGPHVRSIGATIRSHVYQTTEFTVKEFREGSTRLETLMRKLASKLNSNESFHPEEGFQLDLSLVLGHNRKMCNRVFMHDANKL